MYQASVELLSILSVNELYVILFHYSTTFLVLPPSNSIKLPLAYFGPGPSLEVMLLIDSFVDIQ